jgi:NADH:ubiquinone oxidoreductase subunit 6 (subunit J)
MVSFLELVFVINAAMVVFASIGCVISERVMRSVIYLILALVGVAVVFLLANSELLFGLQIIVYGGGIAILLLFAVTLIEQEYYVADKKFLAVSLLVIFLFAANVIIFVIVGGLPQEVAGNIGNRDDQFVLITEFSSYMWRTLTHTMPFLSMLLLSALLGSVHLVLRKEEDEEEETLE